ncbi:MAG TPA: Gfo/Idh/MocA family oxidoreductase [Acidimicrobiales bacterium]|nr:Gfo/Idh/MocA family oxidoreductase [Acidimicrobiales bacterium]
MTDPLTPLDGRRDGPPLVLVARGRPGWSPEREAAIRDLIGLDFDAEVASPRGTVGPGSFDAVLLDGLPAEVDPDWAASLAVAVSAGACLVVLAAGETPEATAAGSPSGASFAARQAFEELLGVAVRQEPRRAEWVMRPGAADSPLADRLPEEIYFEDSLAALEPTTGDVSVVATVSVAFSERAVLTERRVGEGAVVVAGFGASPAGLAHPELRRIVRRALRRTSLPDALHRSLGLGVVGYGPYGGMGLLHGLAAQATPGLVMVAACDGDPGRRKAAEADFPEARAYATHHELAEDDDVEIVVVATPPSSHAAIGSAMLRAGKHVVLEKPMCLTVREADTLIALAGEHDVSLTVHQSRRHDADFRAVRMAVERGDIGEVFNVETFVGGFEHPCRAWHSEVSVSGGAVYDWGSHHLDWILLLMGGFPDRLVAHGHKRVWYDVTNLDQVRVRLLYEDGREAEFVQSDVAAVRRPKFYVQGTQGTIAGWYRPLRIERVEPVHGYVSEEPHHAEGPADLKLCRYAGGSTGRVAESSLPLEPDVANAFHRNLADHLLLGERLEVEPAAGRRVVALLEAAQRSTDEGNVPIDLPRL